MNPQSQKKIGEILIDAGALSRGQVEIGLSEQWKLKGRKRHKRLGEIFVEMGFVTEEDIVKNLSLKLDIPYVDLQATVVDPQALKLVSGSLALRFGILPFSLNQNKISVAMTDPLDLETIKAIKFYTRKEVKPVLATSAAIKKAIESHYDIAPPPEEESKSIETDSLEDMLREADGKQIEVVTERVETYQQEVEDAIRKGKSPPIIRTVNGIIIHAIKNRASDIHIEPAEQSVHVRERIDGLLREVAHFSRTVHGAIISRIKIMAKMDIAERRIPQDGRIKIRSEDQEVDLRVSTMPIQHGEKAVIRVLDPKHAFFRIDNIGLIDSELKRFINTIERPQGIVLVTGPTGSGKSSTLYAMLNHLKSELINIMTLEDPIEYEISGINQIAINEKIGLSFANCLRSVLRQDPDVVMVGEMRDEATANIAIQASNTGHMVLSTLHTNTAVAAITRLRNLNVPPYLIASSLYGIVAQRLVRKLCPQCKQPYRPDDKELLQIGLNRKTDENITFYKGLGCNACAGTGYSGRTGVFEVLAVTSFIRDLIVNNAPEDALINAAVDAGMRKLSEDGIEKVRQGVTSLDELLRVIFIEEEQRVILCPGCKQAVRSDFNTCPFCGLTLMKQCSNCGKNMNPKYNYCPSCPTSEGFLENNRIPYPVERIERTGKNAFLQPNSADSETIQSSAEQSNHKIQFTKKSQTGIRDK